MRFLVCTVLLCITTMAFAGDGSHAEYVGGTVAAIEQRSDGRMRTTDEQFFVFEGSKARVAIPYDRINLLEYGQNVGRRYVAAVLISPIFLISKSRQHFLTVGYTDDDGKQQALVFRVGKGDIRMVLVTLEARTGRKVQYQDTEARKAGKG